MSSQVSKFTTAKGNRITLDRRALAAQSRQIDELCKSLGPLQLQAEGAAHDCDARGSMFTTGSGKPIMIDSRKLEASTRDIENICNSMGQDQLRAEGAAACVGGDLTTEAEAEAQLVTTPSEKPASSRDMEGDSGEEGRSPTPVRQALSSLMWSPPTPERPPRDPKSENF